MSSQKLPVIIAVQDGVSGVISWAFRLQEGFQDHPKYDLRLLFTGRGMEPPVLGRSDAYRASQDDVRRYIRGLGKAIIVPNWLFYIIPICADLISEGQDLRLVGFCRADSDKEYYNPLHWFDPLLAQYAAVSPECTRKLGERLPHRVQDITTMPTAVTVPATLQREYRADPVRVIYAGRISQVQKRVMDFIPLVEHLLALHVNFTFDIAGDGDTLAELKESMGHVPHDNRVRFHGRVPPKEVDALWAGADAYVQTSEYEGTSNSMLEAMAQGVVPVVTDIKSGVEGVITRGENGLIVPIGDMKAMAVAIQRLGGDIALMRRLGQAAYETSKAYSVEAYVEKFARLLDRTLEAPLHSWPPGREYVPGGDPHGYYGYKPKPTSTPK